MNVFEPILDYALKKPGAFLDYPFGFDCPVIKVRTTHSARIFAQVFTLKDVPCATFNCDRLTGEMYRAQYPDAVTRGWHCPPVQQPYFNTVRLDGTVSDAEILRMIDHAYAVVVQKLPRYAQKELTI